MTERRRAGSRSASRRRFLESAVLGSAAVVFTGARSLAAHQSAARSESTNAEAERLAAVSGRYGPEFGPRKAVR